MENDNKILEELKDISPFLSQLENKNPYTVSFSYFDSVADNIVEKIRAEAEPTYKFTTQNPYSLPAGYFANLSATIMQKIENEPVKSEVFEEMEEIAPLLNTISKKAVFTVPGGYFEKAEWNKKLVPEEKGKVVSINTSKKVLNYLAAAIVIGILAIGIFLFTGKENTNGPAESTKAVAEVKALSEQEIVDFLKTTSPTENLVSTITNTNTKENDIRSVVHEISDNEIQQFLAENGEQDEM